LGQYIENKNKYKTKEAIQKLVTITPKDAVILRDGEDVTVTIDEIKKGDIVICRPGSKIAVDGEVIERRNAYR
jgi:Cu+-exporting ATPase